MFCDSATECLLFMPLPSASLTRSPLGVSASISLPYCLPGKFLRSCGSAVGYQTVQRVRESVYYNSALFSG